MVSKRHTMAHGKSIELFLVNGTADSLITAELSNWNGRAIKIPRIEVASCNRDDLAQVGVYFLFSKDDKDADSVYIGESENVKERLIQHIQNEIIEWHTAVIFTGRNLNKALIRYLENRLVLIARDCGRYNVLTKNTYATTIKESEIAIMEEFIDNVKVLINTLGFKVLESIKQPNNSLNKGTQDDESLELAIGDIKAYGNVSPEGFVVYKGSSVNKETKQSLSKTYKTLRTKLIDTKKIVDFQVTEDILFTSSSAAAATLLGYPASGPKCWKNSKGLSLKEIEAKQIDDYT